MIYQFGSESLQCTVTSHGAELVSVLHNGKERLWQNENGGWAGHAPILFPFAGRCKFVKDGILYTVPLHGVALNQEFDLVEKTAEKITFVLHANEQTKECYPFDFSLFVAYMVVGNCLKIEYKAVNNGNETMYASFGSHESYALSGEVDEYEIVFEKEEHLLSKRENEHTGFISDVTKDYGVGRTFVLDREWMQKYTSIFTNVQSNSLTLKKRGEETILAKLTFEGFPNILLWHPADSKMVCIEPWQNLPEIEGVAPQEISKREGLTAIQPGESFLSSHAIEYF